MIQQMVSDAQSNERPGGGGMGGGMGGGYQPQGGNTVTIRIPVTKVGLVIGRGGETIRDFEERSKAKILIASDSSGDSNNERVINLVGDDAATQMAKSLIEDIVFGNVMYLEFFRILQFIYIYTFFRVNNKVMAVAVAAVTVNKEDTTITTVWVDQMMSVFSLLYLPLQLV